MQRSFLLIVIISLFLQILLKELQNILDLLVEDENKTIDIIPSNIIEPQQNDFVIYAADLQNKKGGRNDQIDSNELNSL